MEKKKSYSELLRSPMWQKKRLEIMERDGFTCQYCGREDRELQIHHRVYHKGAKPWEYDDSELITLCNQCHEVETEEKRELYTLFQDICSLSRKCGFSEQLLSSMFTRICGELEMISEDEPFESQRNSVIEDAFYGTQLFHDGKILYDKGIISSCEKMDGIKKYMSEFYAKFIEMYGNENDK